MLGRLDRLPGPQRNALATVFGLQRGAAPGPVPGRAGDADACSPSGRAQPLVCIVDDAQWLDRASAQILGFVARRLLAERVALVFAARDRHRRRRPRRPARSSSSRASATPTRARCCWTRARPVDAAVCDRIVAESHGNPLALLELPRELERRGLAGGFGLPDSRPVAGRIEQSYVRRLHGAPVRHAAARAGGGSRTARRAGLLHRARRRSASTWRRSARGRGRAARDRRARRVRAPARPLRGVRRGRRRGPAPSAPRAGRRDRRRDRPGPAGLAPRPRHRRARRGGRRRARALRRPGAGARRASAAAAAFLQRAVELTPDPARVRERALAAAQAKHAGRRVRRGARHLLAIAEAGPLDELQRAQADLLRAQIAFASSRGRDAPPLLLQAARRLEPLDATLARETYLDALGRPVRRPPGRRASAPGGRRGRPRRRPDARPAGAARRRPAAGRRSRGCTPRATPPARGPLKRGAGRFPRRAMPEEQELRWLWLACHAARALGRRAGWDELTARQERDRAGGRRAVAAAARPRRARGHAAVRRASSPAPRPSSPRPTASSRRPASTAVRTRRCAGGAARASEAELLGADRAAEPGRRATRRGPVADRRREWTRGGAVQRPRPVRGGAGRRRAAGARAVRARAVATWALPELIEAAARSGTRRAAPGGLERLAERRGVAAPTGRSGIEARSRALLSEGDGRRAAATARRSTGSAGPGSAPTLARAHLLYGEWLRRESRRVDAREQLRDRARDVHAIGHGGVRRARPPRAAGDRREGAQADGRDARRAHRAGGADRAARRGRACRTPRSARSCSSARARSSGTCARCSRKLGISSRRELRAALSEDELLITSV